MEETSRARGHAVDERDDVLVGDAGVGRQADLAGARARDAFGADLSPAARARANALRAWRRDTAEELGVAAFRIMGNKTLFAVAEENPRSLAQLSRLVYRQTLNEYGEDILDVLSDCD